MATSKRATFSVFQFMSTGMKVVAALLIAATIAVSGLLVGVASSADSAYAAIYATDENSKAAAGSEGAANSEGAAAAEGEQIEDEENPMSSGLDSAMTSTTDSGIPLYAIVGVGIVAVAVFFLVSTGKLNANISKMNDSVR